ncbi:cycloheximide resistance protein [Stachybotrys elegans]|uniref:Cycloheximide resistance protein n=1 Tax=Stachybotrys elegans TaxID=80388 RepID=A0A8K0SE60_9HYPO|nr:cycloheximide resistance protein [Stachybotrys elegans]
MELDKTETKGEGQEDPSIVDFDGPADPENPLNWSKARKTTSIVIVSLTALLSPIGSTISAAAAADILEHFGSTDEILGTLLTTIYLLGYAFGPLVIAPLSELYGRAVMFRSCAVLFTIFNLACAVADSLGSLIAFRLLAGISGSCAGTLGASSIADMIVREKRGAAMSAYVMGPTFGPTIGPIIGGYLTPAAGWRWGFWFMTIASGVMTFFVLFFLPESYAYAILKRKTAKLRKSTGNHNLWSVMDTKTKKPGQLFAFAILRPLKMLVSPIVFLMSAYAATVFSYAYLCFTTFPRVFGDQYGFGSGASGLANIGIGSGFVLGLLFCGAVSDRWSAYLTKKNNGVAKSEYRLPNLIIGAFFIPVGLFWYGWTAEYKVHWIVPIIGTAFLGIGIVMAYSTTATYLVDAYSLYSASVLAASAILRCLFGALLPLAGNAMFDALDVGWGNSLLGFISLAFLPVPLILYIYGERIRESSFLKMEF